MAQIGGTKLPEGRWEASWLDPKSGRWVRRERFSHAGGARRLASPEYTEDLAVRVLRR
jgi:hypothetical protein